MPIKTYTGKPQTRYVNVSPLVGPDSSSTQTVLNTFYYWEQKPDENNINPPDASGWRKPSGWSMDCVLGSQYMVGEYQWKSHFQRARISGPLSEWSCPLAPLSGPDGAHIAAVITAVLNQIKDAKVNLGVSWGERAEAASLVLETARSLKQLIRDLRRKEFSKLSKRLKQKYGDWRYLPSSFLEFQFGWKPLFNDVYDVCNAILEADQAQPTRQFITAKAAQSRYSQGRTEYPQTFAPTVSVRKTRHDVKARIDFGPNPALKSLATLDQWGILNPAEVAWELVPFSFVVDWFVPIGAFLSSLTAAIPYDFKGGSITEWSHTTISNTLAFSDAVGGSVRGSGSGIGTSESRRFRRNPLTGFPGPSISLGLNGSNVTAQTILRRCAEAVSIIALAVAGRN